MELPNAESYLDINANSVLPELTKHLIQDYFDRFEKRIKMKKYIQFYEYLYLLKLKYCQTAEGYIFIKGFCKARMNKLEYYEVNLKVAQYGEVLESLCACKVGTGHEAVCKHVAIALLGVESMVQNKYLLLDELAVKKMRNFSEFAKKSEAPTTPFKADELPMKRRKRSIIFSPYPTELINKEEYNTRFRNMIINFPNSTMPFKQLYGPANRFSIQNDHTYVTPVAEILHLDNLTTTES